MHKRSAPSMYLKLDTVKVTPLYVIFNTSFLTVLYAKLKGNLVRLQYVTLFLNCLKHVCNCLKLLRIRLYSTKVGFLAFNI